jgi:chromosome segregation ATPase
MFENLQLLQRIQKEIYTMGRPKGTKRINLNNDTEEWHKFCTKEDALAYVERGWCSVKDVANLWPERDSNKVTLSEMEEHMESIEDAIESFNENLTTLMKAIKGLTQQQEDISLQQSTPSETQKHHRSIKSVTDKTWMTEAEKGKAEQDIIVCCWNLQDDPENHCERSDIWTTSEGQYATNEFSCAFNRAD